MIIHRFICKTCGCPADMETKLGESPHAPTGCSNCEDSNFRRDYSGVAVARPMQEHWNNTTGTVVSDMKGFKDDLKRKSEIATLKTGIEHKYEPIDYADMRPVIDASQAQGLEETNRVRHREGKRTIDL